MDKFVGVLIRKERIRKNFSQEGLCRGICAVSYLSKIEKGVADASDEILLQLLERLGVRYETEEYFLAESGRRIERLYEDWFSLDYYVGKGDFTKGEDFAYLKEHQERLLCSRFLIDTMLMLGMEDSSWWTALEEYAVCMTNRQYESYLYVTEQKPDELLRMNPNGFYTFGVAIRKADEGRYDEAIEMLMHAYELSCREGNINEMMLEKIWLGNCYSNKKDGFLMMLEHYRIASRIAKAVGSQEMEEAISYNIGATCLEHEKYEEALRYLNQCGRGDALFYHKKAIALEKTGSPEEALGELEKGYALLGEEEGLDRSMMELVEYRLTHPDYRKDAEYEEKLLTCFARIEKERPRGFAIFHLPFVVEVLESRRKYKEISQLYRRFW